jgi:CBS domain containing-hemolysin-like protein
VASALGFSNGDSLKEKLEKALKQDEDGKEALSAQERTMLLNILSFGESRASDVMVPRADIISIDESASLAELLALFSRHNHSRIPVYNGTLDEATGMVHIKDVVRWMTAQASATAGVAAASIDDAAIRCGGLDLKCIDLSRSIASMGLRRNILFAPAQSSALALLHMMQAQRVHLALIYDEFGGIEGLVSIEDLIEEVVGEIEDEHDPEEEPLVVQDETGLIVNARAEVDDLSKYLGVDLTLPGDGDEPESIGGVILSIAGRLPGAGERVLHPAGYEFEILSVSKNRIGKVRIREVPGPKTRKEPHRGMRKPSASNAPRHEAA